MSFIAKSPIFTANLISLAVHSLALVFLGDPLSALRNIVEPTDGQRSHAEIIVGLASSSIFERVNNSPPKPVPKIESAAAEPLFDPVRTAVKQSKPSGSLPEKIETLKPAKTALIQKAAAKKRKSSKNEPVKLSAVSHKPEQNSHPATPKQEVAADAVDPVAKTLREHATNLKRDFRAESSSKHATASQASLLPPLIKSRQPDYPEEARWEERSGKVILKFKITDKGWVENAEVRQSSGHRDLDLAAMQAIRLWRFDTHEQTVENAWYYYAFRFDLN